MSHLCICIHKKDEHNACRGENFCPCTHFEQATPNPDDYRDSGCVKHGRENCCELKTKQATPLEPKWCEHMLPGQVISVPTGFTGSMHEWMFCPLCGTPRPKPVKESLQEKFEGMKVPYTVDWSRIDKSWAKTLADIAHDHFTKKEQ